MFRKVLCVIKCIYYLITITTTTTVSCHHYHAVITTQYRSTRILSLLILNLYSLLPHNIHENTPQMSYCTLKRHESTEARKHVCAQRGFVYNLLLKTRAKDDNNYSAPCCNNTFIYSKPDNFKGKLISDSFKPHKFTLK